MMKALHLLTDYQPLYLQSNVKPIGAKIFHWSHFPLNKTQSDYYFSHAKTILMVRDLRDICVSMVHHIIKHGWNGLDNDSREKFKSLPFEEQLSHLLQEETSEFRLSEALPDVIYWLKNSNSLLVRFEDIIGINGGGSIQSQILQINTIANFLELTISSDKIYEIASNLFGIDSKIFNDTFREGKIGSWKNSFNEAHKALFKKRYNSYLVLLGYENDDLW